MSELSTSLQESHPGTLGEIAERLIDSPYGLIESAERAPRPTLQAAGLVRNVWWQLARSRFQKLQHGHLIVQHAGGTESFGPSDAPIRAIVAIRDTKALRMVVGQGALGAAEAYLRGYWDSPNLTNVFRLLSADRSALGKLNQADRWWAPLRAWSRWLRRNSLRGSRRNIADHYDLSNRFFELMLDPTMTYSAGWFETPDTPLEEASLAKYERLCSKLALSPNDHVLEIGTGWGGFAEYAASRYRCRVTTTTISNEQYEYARRRIAAAQLEDRVTILQRDYRQLEGRFDKIVSIEMVEAVGDQYLPTYFSQCYRLLRPGGKLALQSIVINEQQFAKYRKSEDFIQRYIFPGGFLPSVRRLTEAACYSNDFHLEHCESMAWHYARTLELWRKQFWESAPEIRKLGFDDRFMRMWHYYLCYCEAGFLTRRIDVHQVLFSRYSASAG